MKTIGLLGGMSWQSTMSYYQGLNQGISERLGGLHSAKIILNSVDFQPIETLQHHGDWDATVDILATAAQAIETAGADFLLICTNTMHKVAPQIQASINIPLLHIADACGQRLKSDGIKTAGLLGTRFTMEETFYKDRLTHDFAINTLIPSEEDRQIVHDIIYQELCHGDINNQSRQHYLSIIDKLQQASAEAVILGCTEIALLIEQNNINIPLYDTTTIHIEAALDIALQN